MTFEYRYLPDEALADIAFEVEADSWDDLFAGAAAAMTAVMANPDDLKDGEHRTVNLEAATVDDLLFDWLGELIFLKDTENFLFRSARVRVESSDAWHLHADLDGDVIDRARHDLGQDVKAVTLHMFTVETRNNRRHAHVVLDL